VNSAGVTAHEFVCGHDEQSWLDVIDINLSGPFRMIRACLPKMIEQRWGRIINIGSTAATTAVADHAAYRLDLGVRSTFANGTRRRRKRLRALGNSVIYVG
jgi:NADP-dependent 3-hydroxy acid dehydrogenase YdfG